MPVTTPTTTVTTDSPSPLIHSHHQVVSLYSGAGGLDLGFARAGFNIVWANERDPFAAKTYATNIGDHIVCGPIEDQDLPERSSAEVVIGGPPCQGFSVAGKMDPEDVRSRHVFVFFDVVERIQPQMFVMENVKALATNARWKSIRQILLLRATTLGYTTKLFLLNASHFGVPQARERMFLIGYRGNQAPSRPRPTTVMTPLNVRSALESLPLFGQPGNDAICTAIITPARIPVLRRSPFAGMLFNGQGRPLDLETPALTLPASMGGNRTPIIDQESLETGAEPWVIGYHRHLMRGGAPAKSVPKRLRRLTVQEAAALQTFPTDWKFVGSQSARFRQIGNAVPPELARHVALAVRRTLNR